MIANRGEIIKLCQSIYHAHKFSLSVRRRNLLNCNNHLQYFYFCASAIGRPRKDFYRYNDFAAIAFLRSGRHRTFHINLI